MGTAMSCFKHIFSPFGGHFSTDIPLKGDKYVRGLLGTTQIKDGLDLWMATDFVVLKELIRAPDDLSRWLCGTSIRMQDFLLGDPACDRIIFDCPPFEDV
jgi:hypothetical protein